MTAMHAVEVSDGEGGWAISKPFGGEVTRERWSVGRRHVRNNFQVDGKSEIVGARKRRIGVADD